jgi:NADH-quinone oxidoreductase subunit K
MPTLGHYLVLSAILFAIGTAGVFVRRNQIIVFFVMTVAAAEAAVGLAIVIGLFRHKESLNPDTFASLKW